MYNIIKKVANSTCRNCAEFDSILFTTIILERDVSLTCTLMDVLNNTTNVNHDITAPYVHSLTVQQPRRYKLRKLYMDHYCASRQGHFHKSDAYNCNTIHVHYLTGVLYVYCLSMCVCVL